VLPILRDRNAGEIRPALDSSQRSSRGAPDHPVTYSEAAMEETESIEAGSESEAPDPIELTKARLAEIGEIWVEFAKQRAESYKQKAESYRDKLPEPLKGYLMPKAKESESEEAAASAPPQSEAA
jgi:hypothetical protein